jgi:hypothetical protein
MSVTRAGGRSGHTTMVTFPLRWRLSFSDDPIAPASAGRGAAAHTRRRDRAHHLSPADLGASEVDQPFRLLPQIDATPAGTNCRLAQRSNAATDRHRKLEEST